MRLMVFAAVLIAACAFGLSASQAQTTPKIRVATTPIDLGAEALYAAELGLFKKAGLDVDLGVLTNGTAVAAAVSGGSIDIGQSNLVALADAHGKGFPFVVVAPAGYYSSKAPTTIMITAANSPIKTAKDLDGKVVTVVALRDITQVGASSRFRSLPCAPRSQRAAPTPASFRSRSRASRLRTGAASWPLVMTRSAKSSSSAPGSARTPGPTLTRIWSSASVR